MELPNYFKGHSLNTPRIVLSLNFEKGLNQWFIKKSKKNFIYNEKYVKEREKYNHLTRF